MATNPVSQSSYNLFRLLASPIAVQYYLPRLTSLKNLRSEMTAQNDITTEKYVSLYVSAKTLEDELDQYIEDICLMNISTYKDNGIPTNFARYNMQVTHYWLVNVNPTTGRSESPTIITTINKYLEEAWEAFQTKGITPKLPSLERFTASPKGTVLTTVDKWGVRLPKYPTAEIERLEQEEFEDWKKNHLKAFDKNDPYTVQTDTKEGYRADIPGFNNKDYERLREKITNWNLAITKNNEKIIKEGGYTGNFIDDLKHGIKDGFTELPKDAIDLVDKSLEDLTKKIVFSPYVLLAGGAVLFLVARR